MIKGHVDPSFVDVANELARMIPDYNGSGAAVAVYHQGRCVVDIWGGERDRAGNPWQADTLALSFSTTKGVVSTLLHVLADQGLIDYRRPVHYYWPEFRQAGKGDITVAHLLTHQSGLYHIRDMIDDASRMTDWQYMTDQLAAAAPVHRPGAAHGYHALTYGWLIGELVQRVTGKTFSEVLRSEISDPLQLDGLFIGLPEEQFQRRAVLKAFPLQSRPATDPAPPRRRSSWRRLQKGVITGTLQALGLDLVDGLAPRGVERFSFNDEAALKACMPAANGMFTARSLARLYATMANGGELDGVRLMSEQRVQQISQVQSRRMDRVVALPMHWRLGYHRVFTTGPRTPHAFGHFGFQGSGAWADPSRQLALGFTVNSAAGSTPFGDARIARLSARAIEAAERLEGGQRSSGWRGLVPFLG